MPPTPTPPADDATPVTAATAVTPAVEQFRHGRTLGVLVRDSTRDLGYMFARNVESDEEYFCHVSGCAPDLWEALGHGDAITFKVSETSKGLRAFDLRRATQAEEVAKAAEWEDDRGNR